MMLLPDPIDDGSNDGSGGDGSGRGATPDPLATSEGAVCPWCYLLDDSTAPTEGIHTCQGCGKEFTTGVMLTQLWLNNPKGGNDAWRWN